MEYSTRPRMPLDKYCSAATTLRAPAWDCAAPPCELSSICPFALQVPWLTRSNPPTRYTTYHPCLHIADPAWQRPGWLGRVGDAADMWVLARREQDGFYYRAQIKTAPELERQGTLLVEFEGPLVTGLKQQRVVLEEVLQLSPSIGYSLQPGDKVLAPWEPDQQQYGPGTILLSLETRDPHRASKEEEIIVQFWNGRTAKVPLGGVRWVPPAVWKKAVERLCKPFVREHPSSLLWAPCCSLLGPVTGCRTHGLPLGTSFLCPPCHPHTCCQLLCQGCLCCCPLAGPTWWPLTSNSEVAAREPPKSEPKPTAQLLPLDGPDKEEVAVHAPVAVSSSSSSEGDLGNDLEMSLPQRLMVNSTVNTDPILLEKPLRQSGLHKPVWRYWRRNGPEQHPGKPGTGSFVMLQRKVNSWGLPMSIIGHVPRSMKNMPEMGFGARSHPQPLPQMQYCLPQLTSKGTRCYNIRKEEDNKQERVQAVALGTTKELALKATKSHHRPCQRKEVKQ